MTPLEWRPTAHAARCYTLAALALLLGLALGRPAVAALAAVPLAFVFRRPARPPQHGTLDVELGAETGFENEPIPLTLRLELERPVELLRIVVVPGAYVSWRGVRTASGAARAELIGAARVRRWGRRDLGAATALLIDDAGLLRAELSIQLGDLATLPQPASASRPTITPLRGGLSGDHRGRRSGAGAEFAGIRPYGPGDSPARVNWPVSLRRQQLHVTQRLAEDAVDVVLVLDAFTDVGLPGHSSLDLSVRGATGLAQALLRGQDRVGLVAIGGWLRWLRPATGSRQFYRVAAAMLDVLGRESYVDPDVSMLPPRAVPSGAHVVMFSPLLDPRAFSAVEQLRLRGVVVTVVDVLTSHPQPDSRIDALALRLWQLDREATAHALAELGVLVVDWDGRVPVDTLLRPALSGRRLVVRR